MPVSSERSENTGSRPNYFKVAIITMIRATEFPAAWSCLRTVDPQLGPQVRHILLLNDARNPELEQALLARDHTDLLTPGHNLGVAAGRNRLIAAALEWGADLIISLDDDLLVPRDYVERVRAWVQDRIQDGERIGIVAPAVLDFHAAAEQTMSEHEVTAAEEGRLEDFWQTNVLQDKLRAAWGEDLPTSAVYHAGMRNWRPHYLESFARRPMRLRNLIRDSRGISHHEPGTTDLRTDPAVRAAITATDGAALPIDTAAGGACAYTADLLQTIGGVDEAFSPFGYEDSDFAIRAVKAGFSNYTLPHELLLHDLDSRQKTRSPAILLRTQGRARALLARKHIPAEDRARTLIELLALAPLQAVDMVDAARSFPSVAGGIIGAVVAYLGGFIDGLFTEPQEVNVAGTATLSEYSSIPAHLTRRLTFTHRSWAGSPLAGLPRELPVDATIAYAWDAAQSRFSLHRLIVDAPGHARVKLHAELDGIGKRDDHGNPDPLRLRLGHAGIEVEDWGLLREFQTTVAFRRRERTTGYLAPLFRAPSSEFGRAFQWFLSLRKEPAHLRIALNPPEPVSVEELLSLPGGINLQRRLGMSTMVNQTVRY